LLRRNAAMPTRRFPPPWSIEELEACYVVRDHDGQQLAYVYFEDERSAFPCHAVGTRLYRNNESFLLRCMSPLLAQSGHPNAVNQCPLLGVKRTSA
jgi:hypothetical protein